MGNPIHIATASEVVNAVDDNIHSRRLGNAWWGAQTAGRAIHNLYPFRKRGGYIVGILSLRESVDEPGPNHRGMGLHSQYTFHRGEATCGGLVIPGGRILCKYAFWRRALSTLLSPARAGRGVA